jgi:hypothetical protein
MDEMWIGEYEKFMKVRREERGKGKGEEGGRREGGGRREERGERREGEDRKRREKGSIRGQHGTNQFASQ